MDKRKYSMEIDKDTNLSATVELLRHAEKQLRLKTVESFSPRSVIDSLKLVHELESHQIELEMQNEELRRAQKELELSRNNYAELYDFAPVGYFTFDARGVIQGLNITGANLLGTERGLLVNKPFSSFIVAADEREIFSGHLEAVLQKQGIQKCAVRLRVKGGPVIHGLFQSVTVDSIENKGAYILSSIVDGTVAKQLEEERARLAMIVDSSNDAIFSVSLDNLITTWNRGAEIIFGYSAQEIIGSQIHTLIPSERYKERSHILQTILRSEQIQHFETTRIRKDGSQIYVSTTISPILDADRKILGYSVIARDVTEHIKMEEIIKHQAHYDTLTDLPNRQLFMELLSLGLDQARSNKKKLALLFLDLNGFKQVNDTLGHSYGDRLLQEVAKRLKACIRVSDTVARFGGDEFTLLMPDLAQTDDVGIVLRKILGVFETPFMLDDVAVDTTASIGVSMFPDDGECGEELMKHADIAMYTAKGSDRNSYQFYNAEINARTIAVLAVRRGNEKN